MDRRAALSLMADLRRAATPLGLLPERVDAQTGAPRRPRRSPGPTPSRSSLFASYGLERGADRLLRRLNRDDPGPALHLLAAGDAPAAQGDHGAAEVAGEGDLRERAPLAADRDRRLARRDDREVAGVADPVATTWVQYGFASLPSTQGSTPITLRRRSPRPAPPLPSPRRAAADDGHASFRQAPPNLLGQPPGLGTLPAPTRADDGDLTPALEGEGMALNRTSPLL